MQNACAHATPVCQGMVQAMYMSGVHAVTVYDCRSFADLLGVTECCLCCAYQIPCILQPTCLPLMFALCLQIRVTAYAVIVNALPHMVIADVLQAAKQKLSFRALMPLATKWKKEVL